MHVPSHSLRLSQTLLFENVPLTYMDMNLCCGHRIALA